MSDLMEKLAQDVGRPFMWAIPAEVTCGDFASACRAAARAIFDTIAREGYVVVPKEVSGVTWAYRELLQEHTQALRENTEEKRLRIWEAIEVMEELWPHETQSYRALVSPKKTGAGEPTLTSCNDTAD